jgi:hypothetical protein
VFIKWFKNLNFRQLLGLSRFFISNPFYIIPTYRATKHSLEICNDKFGAEHHLENKANAYRHAIWSFLLCQEYYIASGSTEKALMKSKKITDLHEQLFPNNSLARAMDLHNNKIGLHLFSEDRQMKIVIKLEKMMLKARKVSSITEIKSYSEDLVYIKD